MPLTKNLAQSSLKMSLKRLRFWDNSRLLTPYGCPEFMFVSGAGPDVRTVTQRLFDALFPSIKCEFAFQIITLPHWGRRLRRNGVVRLNTNQHRRVLNAVVKTHHALLTGAKYDLMHKFRSGSVAIKSASPEE